MDCISSTHRLNTVRDCDKIVVIENGQVAEEGTYGKQNSNSYEVLSPGGDDSGWKIPDHPGFWDVEDLVLLMKRLMRIPMDELP